MRFSDCQCVNTWLSSARLTAVVMTIYAYALRGISWTDRSVCARQAPPISHTALCSIAGGAAVQETSWRLSQDRAGQLVVAPGDRGRCERLIHNHLRLELVWPRACLIKPICDSIFI